MTNPPVTRSESAEDALQAFSSCLEARSVLFPKGRGESGIDFSYLDFERTNLFHWHSHADMEAFVDINRHIVCVCEQGRLTFDQGGGAVVVTGTNAVIMPPARGRVLNCTQGTSVVGVTVSEADFRREAGVMLHGSSSLRLGETRSFDISVNPGKIFADVLEMLLVDMEGSNASRESKAIRLMFDRLIVYSLLRIVEDDFSKHARSASRSVAPRHIKRAEDYIRDHLAEPLDNMLLASIAEVSPRSLYRGFIHFRGVTPARYVQELRLDEAHRILTSGDRTDDIRRHEGIAFQTVDGQKRVGQAGESLRFGFGGEQPFRQGERDRHKISLG